MGRLEITTALLVQLDGTHVLVYGPLSATWPFTAPPPQLRLTRMAHLYRDDFDGAVVVLYCGCFFSFGSGQEACDTNSDTAESESMKNKVMIYR